MLGEGTCSCLEMGLASGDRNFNWEFLVLPGINRAAKFFWSISVISTLKISNFQRKSVIFFVESIGYENTISI